METFNRMNDSSKENQSKRSVYNLKSLKRYLISLSELTKSEEELERLIKKLNIRILPTGSKQYVCESFFKLLMKTASSWKKSIMVNGDLC